MPLQVALRHTERVLFGPFWRSYTGQIYGRNPAPTPFRTVSEGKFSETGASDIGHSRNRRGYEGLVRELVASIQRPRLFHTKRLSLSARRGALRAAASLLPPTRPPGSPSLRGLRRGRRTRRVGCRSGECTSHRPLCSPGTCPHGS